MKHFLPLRKILYVSMAFCLWGMALNAQNIPLVYDVENTGASFPKPAMTDNLSLLPAIQQLPDPFAWADGSGRSTLFADWEKRRNEIKAQIEFYEIGTKPNRPENITATYNEETKVLTVVVTVGENSLTMTTNVTLPAVDPGVKVPVMIGMNGSSLPATVFSSRNIPVITYSHNQITTYNNPKNTDPYYKLYPELNIDNTGQYSAWAWGLSRLIDGIEIALADRIDLERIGVTGCSYAGKMALFCGAFDERVALTVSQESGGGGYTAWRVSQTLGPVENLGATSHEWFSESMFRFANENVPKLPVDHHELMAMVAPRALLVTGNTGQVWLADESGYVASRAAKSIYTTLGIGDRFGMLNTGGHSHCAYPAAERPALEAFVDKFLKGDATVNTDDYFIHNYSDVNYDRWYKYWGTNESTDLPDVDVSGFNFIFLEAENAQVGSLFSIIDDDEAMGGQYVNLPKQLANLSNASSDPKDHIKFTFTITEEAPKYTLFALLKCATADDDSYFVRLDNGGWSMINGLATQNQWMWLQISSYNNLALGEHTLTFAGREDGTNMDRIAITNGPYKPNGKGGKAVNNIPPLVYGTENTGAAFPAPTMNDDIATLPFIQTLPDPFAWADGSGRSISFNNWEKRRNEIKAQIEHYEIGTKPNRPENITATYNEETKVLSVVVTVGENSFTMTTTVNLPAVDPGVKVPVMIGMNGSSLPGTVFSSRNIAQITYNASQLTTSGSPRATDPFFKLYPEQNMTNTGQYSVWAWGLSRLIDGLEIALADRIDLERIGVTGCSYAGKMALFCGAFDERVALTVSQESGGGGYTAWRVSETVGDVEKLGATSNHWFKDSMFDYAAANVPHLPIDHHELMAMVAPRALLVTGNEGQVWLADKSGYVASRAAKNIYETFGIGDRFGMLNVGGHGHCAFPEAERAGLEAFVDKFLKGDESVDTDSIFVYPEIYEGFEYKFWMPWANVGSDTDVADFWREAESNCITIGGDFTKVADETASNGNYLATGTASAETAPATRAGRIDIPFVLDAHGNYAVYTRVNVAAEAKDSLWISIDSRPYKKVVIPSTNGVWTWVLLGKEDLLTGKHTLSIGAATTTGKIDRIYIGNRLTAPTESGGTESACVEIISSVIFDFENSTIAYQSNTDWNLWNGRNLGAIVTTDKHGGEKSLELKSTTATEHWRTQAFSPAVELISGDRYQISFWAKALTTSAGDLGEGVMQWGTRAANSLVSSDESNGNQYWGLTTVTGDWKKYTYTGLVAKGTTFQLAIECGSINDRTYYIDDIEIRNVDLSPVAITPVQGSGYSLGQIYPNPSKGISYIPFEIQETGYVSLKVYNLTGQEVAELAGKEYLQGKHQLTIDSSNLPKGIYIYTLRTNNFSASKKLTVK